VPTLTRTVVVPSKPLTLRKLSILKELEEMYMSMLREAIEYGYANKVHSFTGLKKALYYKLRSKYPQLPSHYIHTVCQDASARLESFFKLRKRGLVKTEKPEIRRVSIWLDDHLWKPLGYTAMRIATHKGYIVVELELHKLFWKYINSGWKMRTQPKLKINYEERRVYIYFVFEKDISVQRDIWWQSDFSGHQREQRCCKGAKTGSSCSKLESRELSSAMHTIERLLRALRAINTSRRLSATMRGIGRRIGGTK